MYRDRSNNNKLFTNMDIKDEIINKLRGLNLSEDESRLYLELLREPSSHLKLSRATGINRTKVYRLIGRLEERSLVTRNTDDRGTFLVATDPAVLEVAIVTQEEELRKKREILSDLMPQLSLMQSIMDGAFIIRTYQGSEGLKQMCWHELKTKGELISFGNGTIEQLVADPLWADRHRKRQLAAGYKTRELISYDESEALPDLTAAVLSDNALYQYRTLPHYVLTFDGQTLVYNDTVAIYHWKHNQKVGVEIINAAYANMLRQMFEHYWRLAS